MHAKFMTGIHGGFDRVRVARETRPGFHGLEVSCLRDPGEAKEVADYASAKGLATGVHFPLVSGTYPAVGLHPWLTSRDEHVRNAGLRPSAGTAFRAARGGNRPENHKSL